MCKCRWPWCTVFSSSVVESESLSAHCTVSHSSPWLTECDSSGYGCCCSARILSTSARWRCNNQTAKKTNAPTNNASSMNNNAKRFICCWFLKKNKNDTTASLKKQCDSYEFPKNSTCSTEKKERASRVERELFFYRSLTRSKYGNRWHYDLVSRFAATPPPDPAGWAVPQTIKSLLEISSSISIGSRHWLITTQFKWDRKI